MWELYNLLKLGVGDNNQYLIDEISGMLDKISPQNFRQSLLLLYNNFSEDKLNPVQILTMFILGLKMNEFFQFCDFVKALNGST